MSEPNIRAAYRAACPGIAGRILTAHEAAEADAMRAAAAALLRREAVAYARACLPRRAAWCAVLWLLLAPEAI